MKQIKNKIKKNLKEIQKENLIKSKLIFLKGMFLISAVLVLLFLIGSIIRIYNEQVMNILSNYVFIGISTIILFLYINKVESKTMSASDIECENIITIFIKELSLFLLSLAVSSIGLALKYSTLSGAYIYLYTVCLIVYVILIVLFKSTERI